jgi:hypothetical protein
LKENVVTKLPNYYGVLGVPSTASQDEIRKAYRRLARRYHPDVNPLDKDDVAANEFMRQLNEAYAVLGDTSRRVAYDRQRWAQFWPPRQSGTRRSRPAWSWADERRQRSRASSKYWWDLATPSVTTNWPRPNWLPKFPVIPEFFKVRLQLLTISLLGPLLVLASLIVVTSVNSASGEVCCTAVIFFPLFLGAWAALWRWSVR